MKHLNKCPQKKFLFWTYTKHDWKETGRIQMSWDMPITFYYTCQNCGAEKEQEG